ncbi:MAG: PDZ domain-containing protein [Verrucomicrobia bacterium]|nr:PDZ domain-containing protein [Verrucomicrobiota bacterium]
MSQSFRRLLSLALVFSAAFLAVSAMRRCGGDGAAPDRNGGRAERFSLPDAAPLDLGDVQLLERINGEYANLTRAVVPSVVSIDTAGVRTETLRDFWGRRMIRRFPTQGQGSGVIVTNEGHVVTNHHVIAGQQEIQVTLYGGGKHNGGEKHKAVLVGEDPQLDIAVIRIEGGGSFTPLKFGDSSQAQVGQIVFAIGNPFGLGETVTQGIISAKERFFSDNQRDLLQTDAAINPGNSGGPLVNLRGEIIGINVAIFSPDRENPGYQGVGFSIPSNDVKDALMQILERGRPVRGFLGVELRDLDVAVRSVLQYQGETGVCVMNVVPGSPAEIAGLQSGDVIVSFNGEAVRASQRLFLLIQSTKVGESVRIDVWRQGRILGLSAAIAESGVVVQATRPPDTPRPSNPAGESAEILRLTGVEVRELSMAERLRGFRGVMVARVMPQSLAAGKLEPGDLVIEMNGRQIQGVRGFHEVLISSAGDEATSLRILRDGRMQVVTLPSPADHQ